MRRLLELIRALAFTPLFLSYLGWIWGCGVALRSWPTLPSCNGKGLYSIVVERLPWTKFLVPWCQCQKEEVQLQGSSGCWFGFEALTWTLTCFFRVWGDWKSWPLL